MEIILHTRAAAIHELSPSAGLAKAPEKGYNCITQALTPNRGVGMEVCSFLVRGQDVSASCSCLRILLSYTIITVYIWKCKSFQRKSTYM